MTNRKGNDVVCRKSKRDPKKYKPRHADTSQLEGDRRMSKSYEAARRRRFNDTIDILRDELELKKFPKVKILENAIKYIKHCKAIQQCILHDNMLNEEDDVQQKDEDCDKVQANFKLKRIIYIYKRILEEARISVDFIKESNHICAAFPVIQSSEENINIKKKIKKYDLFFNKLHYEDTSEIMESKNAATQCEISYFDKSNSHDDLSNIIDANVSKTATTEDMITPTTSNIEELTEACFTNGKIVVSDVEDGVMTVWVPDESAADKELNVVIGDNVEEVVDASCVIPEQDTPNVVSVASNCINNKISTTETQKINITTPTVEENVAVACPNKVLILPVQRNLPTPHLTLVTPSPTQGPIMSTGRSGSFLKANGQNSLILLSSILPSRKKLKKIAPKPSSERKTGVGISREENVTEIPLVECGNKRKCLWETEKVVKMSKVDNKYEEQLSNLEKPTDDDDSALQEIPPTALNALVRNSIIVGVDGEDRPLENLMDFSCITNADHNSDSENTLDASESLVEIFCSMSESKAITAHPLASISKDSITPQLPLERHAKLDNESVDKTYEACDINNKTDDINEDCCENSAVEPSTAKSSYSVMSLCMPSKLNKVSSTLSPHGDTSIQLVSLGSSKCMGNNENNKNNSLTTPTTIPATSFININEAKKVDSNSIRVEVESTTPSLTLGSLSSTYHHSFQNIPIPSLGMPVLTSTPFSADTVSHSISRISCPTVSMATRVPEISQKANVVTDVSEPIKSSDSKKYSDSSASSLAQVTPTTSVNTTESVVSTAPVTCIGSAIFPLSTIPSYSHQFGFCPLSIPEAPTTFSFTLTTQTSASSVGYLSTNNSTSRSSENIAISESQSITNKFESINPQSISSSKFQPSSPKGKSVDNNFTLPNLLNLQLGFIHKEPAPANEPFFNSLKPVATCGSLLTTPPPITNSSESSVYSPLRRTPLKPDVASTIHTLRLPLTNSGTDCNVSSEAQICNSITYSTCSLSSVSSVLSSTSIPLIASSVQNPNTSSIFSNIIEPSNKKDREVIIPIERLEGSLTCATSRSQLCEKFDDSRPSCKEPEISAEFKMPLLPLSSYASPILKCTSDVTDFDAKSESMLSRANVELNDIRKNNLNKISFRNSKSNNFTNDLLDDYSRNHPDVLKNNDLPSKVSLQSSVSLGKDKQCLQVIEDNEALCQKSNMELELTKQSKHSQLRNNSEDHVIEANKQPVNNSRNEKDEGSFSIKDQFHEESQNELRSLKENQKSVNKDAIHGDGQLFSHHEAKTTEQNKSLNYNPTVYETCKNISETFSGMDKNVACKISESSTLSQKSSTCPTTFISFSSPKCGLVSSATYSNEQLLTLDRKIDSRKKVNIDNTPTEKDKRRDINNPVAKTSGGEAKPISDMSERIVTTIHNHRHGENRFNLDFKFCDGPTYSKVMQTQGTHEQVATHGNHQNVDVTSSGQILSPKIQTSVNIASLSNMCSSSSVSNHKTHSPSNAAIKSQQITDPILMCSSDANKLISISLPNNHLPQFEQPLNHHSLGHHQAVAQQQLPSLAQHQSTPLQNIQATNIFPLYTGTERETNKISTPANNMSTVMPGCSYVQSFDYNSYYRKSTNVRLDSRYNCHGYKQFSQNNNDLSDTSILHNQLPTFAEGHDELSVRGAEISPADHLRGFSVSHLVSQSSETRKTTQKDNISDDKPKETAKVKSTSKKSEGKGRASTAIKNTGVINEARQRGQVRSTANFSHCFNNKPQTKNIHNYSTEALLSSQNYGRHNHKQAINQNYFMPPNQMYQPSYSSQQVKNLSQNTPFSYNNYDRGGPSMHCNTDYNFQLHPQASSTLAPYGSNMPYMAPSYPYQNIPPSSSSMISGDIMGAHHAGAYRLPDISDQSNFHSNTTFTLPMETQEVCASNVIGAGQSTMTARMPVTESTFGISTPSMHYRNTAIKNGGNQQQASVSTSKRSKYFDTGMIATGVTTPTNFFDGGSLTHIPIHSFTPPCEDATPLMPTNLLSGPSRHQNNFLIGHDSVMSLNESQYQDTNLNTIGANLTNQHLQMPSISKGAPVPQILSSNATARSDRQLNTSATHLSSSLANFNLTSIIPEIDGKHDDSDSTMSSSSSRQLAMGSDAISMTAYNRFSSMGASFAPASNTMKDVGPQVDANHRFVPVLNNSMNNIFGHSHQVGLNLNTGLHIPTSTFSGMSFQPSEH